MSRTISARSAAASPLALAASPHPALVSELERHSKNAVSLLRAALLELLPHRICAVSSFGAEAAVSLALVAEIDPTTPVIFLETGKHFPETLAYRDALVARLGLKDVRSIPPSPEALTTTDPDGLLWKRNPDHCCLLRKVLPLSAALTGFDAWITGRKRFHGGERAELRPVEFTSGRIKINPLANWSHADIVAEFARRGLPRHPLVAKGYLSIGCAPCTGRSARGGLIRAGRWPGSTKTECGIHRR